MTNQRDESAAPSENESAIADGVQAELAMMYRTFMASAERMGLLILLGAVVAVVGATAYGQIRLNAWNRPFYDALAQKDFQAFATQLFVFTAIAGGLLILNVAQMWLNQTMKLRLRQGLVRDLLDQWLEPKRAFRLAGAGEIGVNPDQRVHEDARHLTELSTDLGIGLLQSSLLLISFIGVLWLLSERVIFSIAGRAFSIPGYMVWCALLYAAAGSLLSWRIGRPLISLDAERYQRESDLRFALVRVNEHADSIALYGGEADEKQLLRGSLDAVLAIMRRLVTGLTRLTWVTAGYGWFAIIAPFLVAAPGFFGGPLTLGELMMVVGAFNQVQQALRWFVDNFNTIADWVATLRRVASFRRALAEIDKLSAKAEQIEYAQSEAGKIIFEGLSVVSSVGRATFGETRVEISHGERVLIKGDSDASLAALFRVVAGLWLRGSGSIGLPSSEVVMFMPRHPYMPPGGCREALAYPLAADAFRNEELMKACNRVGLSHFHAVLDHGANWDNDLGVGELQRLAVARLLLHKPRWIFIEEAMAALEEDDRRAILAIFDEELREASVITLGRRDLREGFSKRVLHLVATQDSGLSSTSPTGQSICLADPSNAAP